ncbi:MAG TPA: hypothetical protein VHJ20_18450 [Polyangia bacterium]|nr:hypothetical protein [Polyangia bacterium]
MKGLSIWRATRWVALAATIPALWACTARKLAEPSPEPNKSFVGTFQQTLNRDIDILFMVDNSSSMLPLQAKLKKNFPAFMDVLKSLPLPNVHIAVVSSDLGAGKSTDAPGCNNTGGDQGKFQFAPKDPAICANAQLNAGQHFISNINGMANYSGDISDAFSCIAGLGDSGCGLEHQFGSVLRALGADGNGGAPVENANFLRSGAYLAVILITNEDDCSAPINSDVFNGQTSQYVSDPLGPLVSYRCNFVGHICDGAPPPKSSAGGPYKMCVSNETGPLLHVADVVAGLKGLKTDPSKILVAAITGPPLPYEVTDDYTPTNNDPAGNWPQVKHSCTQADGTYADPSVRIWQWLQAFQTSGVFESICSDSFTPALQGIADAIGKKLGSQCVEGTILDTTDDALWAEGNANSHPDCTVTDHNYNSAGTRIDSTVPPCYTLPANTTTLCWELAAGTAAACNGQHTMTFKNRDPNAATSHIDSSVACSVKVCPPAGTANAPAYCP